MLHGFSTSRFLTVLVLLGLLWYGGVLFFFYLKKKRRPSDPGIGSKRTDRFADGPRYDQSGPDSKIPLADDLMGKPKLPEGMSSVGMEEIGFVGVEERDVEDQQGLVPDLLEEIKNVFLLLAKEDGNKRDFLELMKAVKEVYPGMASHPRIGRINGFIAEHAAFHLSAEELENLWY
ncbi:hypothetical protein HDC90_005160 [Pedobacter sp. AK013]|uniref:hypothetical protein n=1 Tax=Pedobacter sp. AK013 TaxID=2723071 RepID=UPI0016132840|nr:hypothetical protein [Pedobacter sp. AK013]MBB6240483.1 hypothetical protein [Pedobacter sp. AK013]